MTRCRPSGTRTTAVVCAWLTLGALSFARQSAPPETGHPDDEAPAPRGVKDVGGRLVVSGESVEVVADPDEAVHSWSVREPAALDRIQYLRGPAAVLYGDGSPGGLVNLMLKKPLPTPRYEASLSVGELGFRRFTADATGPLSKGRRARFRLVAAAEGLENGFDNGESRVSVLLSFDLGPKTTLHVDGEYYDQRGRGYRHTLPPLATPSAATSPRFPGT